MANLLNISSVPAETIKDSELQIICRWKDTDKRPIAAANRVRAVILPSTIWKGDASVATVSTSNAQLALFILDATYDLAVSYLRAIVEDSNWQRAQVNADAFTLSNLLQWNADQAAINGRLNGDEIKKWVESSATVKHVATLHGDKVGKAIGDQFVKLASPNHGLTPEKAGKLLETLWQKEDADSTTGLRVQLKLSAIRDKKQDDTNVLDSIL